MRAGCCHQRLHRTHCGWLVHWRQKLRFFINFTVIFLSLQDNPAFQNYRGQHEGHRVV
jgi:hypothetical protein